MADLAATERAVLALVDSYRAQLVDSSIYGMPSLAWPDAVKQDYFVAWKTTATQVSLYLLPVLAHPDVLDRAGERVRAAQTGTVTFGFRSLDDELEGELAGLLAELFERYRADHAG